MRVEVQTMLPQNALRATDRSLQLSLQLRNGLSLQILLGEK